MDALSRDRTQPSVEQLIADLDFYAESAAKRGDPWHDGLTRLLLMAAQRIEVLSTALQQVTEDRARLTEALKKYGWHINECVRRNRHTGSGETYHCDCGFSAALSGVDPVRDERRRSTRTLRRTTQSSRGACSLRCARQL